MDLLKNYLNLFKRNGHCFFPGYNTRGLTSKRDSFCASYCLYTLYLTKVIGIDFKSAVLNLYYRRVSWIEMVFRKIAIDIIMLTYSLK